MQLNKSLDSLAAPKLMQSLAPCISFNQNLDNVSLPPCLQSLTVGVCFNQSLDDVTRQFLPNSFESADQML